MSIFFAVFFLFVSFFDFYFFSVVTFVTPRLTSRQFFKKKKKSMLRVVIVGGIGGGASCAARLRRLSELASITMFEKGELVSSATCGIPYYLSGEISDRAALTLVTPELFKDRFNIDARVSTEVLTIDRAGRTVTVKALKSGEVSVVPYDKLVLSTGSFPVCPAAFRSSPLVRTIRSLKDMDSIKKALDDNPAGRVVVVGGGFIGVEVGENLRKLGRQVTMVEGTAQVLGSSLDKEMAKLVHREIRRSGIDLRLSTTVTEVDGAGVSLSGSTKEFVPAGLVIVAIGVRPDTSLAKQAGLTLGERGGVVVDDTMRTSDPNIYAVGDCIEVPHTVTGRAASIALGGPANREGRRAAEAIALQLTSGSPWSSQGTSICRVFDLVAASTGLTESQALAAYPAGSGVPVQVAYLRAGDHAGYYPGAEPISFKIVFDGRTGRVLGAQAVGKKGVDKRVDVLAMAVRSRSTVMDLEQSELCYSPPFDSAKDPVNVLGMIATNILSGRIVQCRADELSQAVSSGSLLLDVRKPEEVTSLPLPFPSLNIPLDSLRARLTELPRDRPIIVICATGHRSYTASCLLRGSGFQDVKNMAGGHHILSLTL